MSVSERKLFERILKYIRELDKANKKLFKSARSSRRLSNKDLMIRINI